jgi:vacuolar-type H+-ATPase subunit E/Vma4
MPTIKLIDIIRRDSEKVIREYHEQAQAEADAILEKARESSEQLKEQARLRIRGEAEAIMEKRFNMYRFQTNAKRYELKASAIERIWADAADIIAKIRLSEAYADILQELFDECAGDVPEGSIVRTSPEDADIVKTFIGKSGKNLVLETDERVRDGVEFVWPDRKIAVKNTLSHRLEKLKGDGVVDISAILFASGEGSES